MQHSPAWIISSNEGISFLSAMIVMRLQGLQTWISICTWLILARAQVALVDGSNSARKIKLQRGFEKAEIAFHASLSVDLFTIPDAQGSCLLYTIVVLCISASWSLSSRSFLTRSSSFCFRFLDFICLHIVFYWFWIII